MKKIINWPVWRTLWFPTGWVVLVAAAWKTVLITREVIPFNGDEAVVALMARHILQGVWPVFMYGQAYMGSLDAGLIAFGFWLFGQQVWVIRFVQVILYVAILLSTIGLGKEAWGKWSTGILSAALLAIPTVNVTLYTTASQGGYGETLLIGNLLLMLAFKMKRSPRTGLVVLWGVLAGLGFWADGLTLVYSVPGLVWMVYGQVRDRQPILAIFRWLAAAAIGAGVGLLPVWLFVVQKGILPLLKDLTGSAMSVETGGWLARVGQHLLNFLLLGLPAAWGLRPPWSVEWLALPLLPFVLVFWLAVTVFFVQMAIRSGPERKVYSLLAGVPLCILLGFLFTSFGVDPSGRYFVPMAVPLAFAAVGFVSNLARDKKLSWVLLGLVVVYQITGNLQVMVKYPPGLTTQIDRETIVDHRFDAQLIGFLKEKGETRGYSNYWVAYPLAFLSGEELIFSPRLPYHSDLRYTPRDVRYLPHAELVAASSKIAYISTSSTPALDGLLRRGLGSLGVSWQEQIIGDYHVFYGLSRAVHPQELGLGGSEMP